MPSLSLVYLKEEGQNEILAQKMNGGNLSKTGEYGPLWGPP